MKAASADIAGALSFWNRCSGVRRQCSEVRSDARRLFRASILTLLVPNIADVIIAASPPPEPPPLLPEVMTVGARRACNLGQIAVTNGDSSVVGSVWPPCKNLQPIAAQSSGFLEFP